MVTSFPVQQYVQSRPDLEEKPTETVTKKEITKKTFDEHQFRL